MANKTITIKPSKKTLKTLKYMKELKDLQKEITILKFKNEELQKQLNLCDVSNSFLEIDLKSWEHTCGDGCCYTGGLDIFLNGEQLDEQNAEDSVNALTAVLTKLGYNFEINCY